MKNFPDFVFIFKLIKKSLESVVLLSVSILVIWGFLYHLTDAKTVTTYFGIGFAVCIIIALLHFLRNNLIKGQVIVSLNWVIEAGLVLLLYHANFELPAVFAAAILFASPYFGRNIYNGVVGLSLLITLAVLMYK